MKGNILALQMEVLRQKTVINDLHRIVDSQKKEIEERVRKITAFLNGL